VQAPSKNEAKEEAQQSEKSMPWELGDDEPLAFIEAKDIEEETPPSIPVQ
jgi:hypothetical protein